MTRRTGRLPALAAGLLLLSACGGGGGGGGGDGITASGDRPAGDPSFAAGTVRTAALSYTAYEGDGTLLEGTKESVVNLSTGAVTGGAFAGTLNAARTRIDLAGGGTVTLTNPGGTEYLRIFERQDPVDDPSFGVVGFQSDRADLPASGRVSYTGAANVLAADATRTYTLKGTAYIVADFGDGTVLIELRNLGGTANGIGAGNLGSVAVPRGGSVTVEGSRIAGATFSGGRASVAGLPFSVTGRADASGTRGAFFGPGADEVGGRVVVDDPRGDVGILGTFAAD